MSQVITRDITKVYQVGDSEVHAVDGLDLAIDRGEFLSIMGPSGSGKSTLLNLLGCLDTPTTGQVLIDGVETGSLSSRQRTRLRREKIGFVFQEFNLLPVLNAVENVELPLRYLGVGSAERRRRAHATLEKVGLDERSKHRPSQMSGGEQQRVAIARALVTDPVIVLADEPSGELDTGNTRRILELMRDLNRDLSQTFAVVTHDPMVAEYTRRVVLMRDGKVAEDNGSS